MSPYFGLNVSQFFFIIFGMVDSCIMLICYIRCEKLKRMVYSCKLKRFKFLTTRYRIISDKYTYSPKAMAWSSVSDLNPLSTRCSSTLGKTKVSFS